MKIPQKVSFYNIASEATKRATFRLQYVADFAILLNTFTKKQSIAKYCEVLQSIAKY